MYINNHTYYSLRYGTIKPKELLTLAKENGAQKFVLSDINNTSACLDFVRLAPKYGITPVLGIDFRNKAIQQFIGIAKNNKGFEALNTYLSVFLHKGDEIPERAESLADAFVVYPFSRFKNSAFELREHEFLGVTPKELTQLKFSKELQVYLPKMVVLHTVSFRNKQDFNAHRLLRSIDNNTLLSKLSPEEEGSPEHKMLPAKELKSLYADFPIIIENTEWLLSQCSIDFELGQEVEPKNQKCYTANEGMDFRLMRKLAYSGMKYRYKRPGKRIFNRLEKELEIIQEKGFVSYFLINWKILKYARSKGYFYVGRGSGANSIVAYLLRITDVDPVELDLYFERFINLYRKNPPDFDIDFSWTDRDDVTRFIFERFPNSSLLAVYNTFQYKAVVRELGKVFGLPKHEIDVLSKGKFDVKKLDQLNKLVLHYGALIQDFPNYLSIHAAGILISEKPIHYYTATFMPPKGYPTTQFDMIVAEDVGLYKFDILSQRGLGKIKDTLDVIRYNHPRTKPIDIHDIDRFKRDKKVKHLLRNAMAIGCFYVESPAMRMLLKKLQVDNYLGLVAASSVIRPGVAKSGMMREYILRYRYPEKRKDAHPVMLELMPETYGVMVYQEDVIKVAHFFAGMSLGEADMLRRGMSGKFRSRAEFAKVKRKFFDNCEDKGHSRALTEEVWRQTESFAGYAFAKGHSASYAVESYQSLFLKAYYPLEYMVATINNFGGFYRTELYVHEARMHGADICAPCVNRGRYETVILYREIFLGFILLQQLEIKTAKQIVAERDLNGAFTDFNDFVERVPISVEQVSILIRINAFRFTGKDKRSLLWEAHFKLDKKPSKEFEPDLFRLKPKEFRIPTLENVNYADAFDEMELLGFSLNNPFSLLLEPPEKEVLAKDLVSHKGKFVTVVGYLVTVKNTMTGSGKKMHFGTFLDHEGQWLDTVHFPPVAERYPFRGGGVYTIVGKVMEEFDCYNIEVERMYKSAIIEDPRYSDKSLSA